MAETSTGERPPGRACSGEPHPAWRPSTLQEPMRSAAAAYREGRRKVIQWAPAASGVGFDRLLDEALSWHRPVAELLLMRASSGARSRGLSAARGGRLSESAQALHEGRALLESPCLSVEGRMIAEAFLDAAAAYLDFRRGEYESARRRVRRALANDGALITRHGFFILELHRIQLAHNLMRIEARAGSAERALQIGADLLSYMEGERARWPVPDLAEGASPAQLPADLVAAMFTQITGEVAIVLAHAREGEAARLFAPLAPHAAQPVPQACARHARAHLFLRAKQAWAMGDAAGFLGHAAALLREGRAEAPVLWCAVASDVGEVARALGGDEALELAREIDVDAEAWSGPAAALRSRDRRPGPPAGDPRLQATRARP